MCRTRTLWKTQHSISTSSPFTGHSLLLLHGLTRNQPKHIFCPTFLKLTAKHYKKILGATIPPQSAMRNIPSYTYIHTHAHFGVYFLLGFIVLEPLTQAGVPVPVHAQAGWLCQGAGCSWRRTQAVWGDVPFGTATAHTEEQSSDHLVHTCSKWGLRHLPKRLIEPLNQGVNSPLTSRCD